MKRSGFLLAAISGGLLIGLAQAATRPHYGGTLRVSTHASLNSLDPAEIARGSSLTERNLCSLIFDTLVTLDDHGKPQAGLAASWQAEPGNQRWQFQLRPNVTFQDGTALTADQVAAALRIANPSWKILPSGESVMIQRETPAPHLLAELALIRNAIVKRGGQLPVGTGPFTVADWTPGKKLMLAANNDYWNGRPFVNSIEVVLGQTFPEQTRAFDTGKLDLIEVAPDQARQMLSQGKRVQSSSPAELIALVFARESNSAEERRLRTALGLSLDRADINNILLQGAGEPTAAILPNWMSGYAFLFSTATDSDQARQIRGNLRLDVPWTLAYDSNDPASRLVVERIILNARDVNLAMQLTNSSAADIKLVRIPLTSLNASAALTNFTVALGLNAPSSDMSRTEELFAAENAILQTQRVIPLLHLRASYAMNAAVQNWKESPDGSWRLSDVWLDTAKP